jgi:hypothetical protein
MLATIAKVRYLPGYKSKQTPSPVVGFPFQVGPKFRADSRPLLHADLQFDVGRTGEGVTGSLPDVGRAEQRTDVPCLQLLGIS